MGIGFGGLIVGEIAGGMNMRKAFDKDPEAMRRILLAYYVWQAKRASKMSIVEGQIGLSEHNNSYGLGVVTSSIMELERMRDNARRRD